MQTNIDRMHLPFTIGEGSPAEIGQKIATIYSNWDKHPPLVTDIWQAATQTVGLSEKSPLFMAGHEMAAALDSGMGTGLPGGYHNTQHYIEVLSNVTHIVLRNNATNLEEIVLSSDESGKLLFAALGHDFYYEAGDNKHQNGDPAPYRLEQISFDKTKPYLAKHGVGADDIGDIGVMIYGTDVSPASKAGSFVRAAHSYLFECGQKPATSDVLAKVHPVLKNPRLARMAALLSDADILSSAGLTAEYGNSQSQKLGAEWGKPMWPQDTIGFLTFVAENRFITRAARFFEPNMDAIRQDANVAIAANAAGNESPMRPVPSVQEANKPAQ